MTDRRSRDHDDERSVAEWVTLAVSSAILLVVVGLVAVQLLATHDPAAPTAEVTDHHTAPDGSHHVEVTVTNHGDETASNVQISAELIIKGETTEGEQVIDFLAGGEDEAVVFVFADDPDDGQLSVDVVSFAEP